MNDTWIERWNDRYSKNEYAYGEQPALPSESPVSGTLMRRLFPGKPYPHGHWIVVRAEYFIWAQDFTKGLEGQLSTSGITKI